MPLPGNDRGYEAKLYISSFIMMLHIGGKYIEDLRLVDRGATRSRGQELFSLSSLERKPHILLCEPTQLNKVALGTKYKSNTRGRNRERTSLPTAAILG